MFVGFFNLYFIGILFIIVYVGAVTVLFLFIIIIIPLRDADFGGSRFFMRSSNNFTVVLFLLSIALFFVLNDYFGDRSIYEILPVNFLDTVDSVSSNDLDIVSKTIYFKYSFALVVAALLLFVALIIAILLCSEF
jgi:NADH:ubiquinone oxidoreductase subunit 6 (subunit J)